MRDSFKKCDWVAVIYGKIWYPGQIIDIRDKALATKFLWLSNIKILHGLRLKTCKLSIFPTQVLCKIEAPRNYKKNMTDRKVFNLLRKYTANSIN